MNQTAEFEAFMSRHQNLVYTRAMRLLGNNAEAQDIAQEVFLKAYAHFRDLAASPTAPGWLKTVTTNMCLNHLSRYRARWRFFSEMFSRNGDDQEMPIDFAAPDSLSDQVDEADYRHVIEKELRRLPAAQRVPLVLYHYDGQSYEEIARRLGVSLAKVKTDIFRGRERLRKRLMQRPADENPWILLEREGARRQSADEPQGAGCLFNPLAV